MTAIDLHLTQNGVTIHVLNMQGAEEYLPREVVQAYLDNGTFTNIGYDLFVSTLLTFGDMAKFILGEQSYDFALPQEWTRTHRTIAQHCVWLYESNDYIGRPYHVTENFRLTVIQLVKAQDYEYTMGWQEVTP